MSHPSVCLATGPAPQTPVSPVSPEPCVLHLPCGLCVGRGLGAGPGSIWVDDWGLALALTLGHRETVSWEVGCCHVEQVPDGSVAAAPGDLSMNRVPLKVLGPENLRQNRVSGGPGRGGEDQCFSSDPQALPQATVRVRPSAFRADPCSLPWAACHCTRNTYSEESPPTGSLILQSYPLAHRKPSNKWGVVPTGACVP